MCVMVCPFGFCNNFERTDMEGRKVERGMPNKMKVIIRHDTLPGLGFPPPVLRRLVRASMPAVLATFKYKSEF